MKVIYYLLFVILCIVSCQEKGSQKNSYGREAEMIAFCKALGVPTTKSVKVLYIPYSRCSSCQLSSPTIINDSTPTIHVVHFNEWKGRIDNKQYKYIRFGKIQPNDFGVITPYPLLLGIENDKIVSYEHLFK